MPYPCLLGVRPSDTPGIAVSRAACAAHLQTTPCRPLGGACVTRESEAGR